jgi:WD40 repeat protein
MQLLHSESLRNLAIVYKKSLSVVRFVDLHTHDTFHVIRTTAPVVSMAANEYVLALVLGDGTIKVHSSESLEEHFSFNGSTLALGDRWAAYIEQTTAAAVSSWTATSVAQDAFDNLVIAVSGCTTTSSPIAGSPVTKKTSSIISIRDVVTGEIVSTIDPQGNCETLYFSACGMKIFASFHNGHFVNVYQVVVGGEDHKVKFQHAYSLNRGMTPAKITSISSHKHVTAVCSSRGTIHLFNTDSSGPVIAATCRIRPAADEESENGRTRKFPKIIFTFSGQLVVLQQNGIIETYSLNDDDSFELVETLNVGGDLEGENFLTENHLPKRTPSRGVMYETCEPLPVPYWMSPMFTGLNSQEGLVHAADARVRDAILHALSHNPLPEENQEDIKFRLEATGKDEFVQIVMESSASSG